MTLDAIRQAQPAIGVVLGSGLGAVADAIGTVEHVVPYSDIPSLPAATAPGHAGRLLLVRSADTPLLIAQGRSHLYEGCSAAQVTAHIRVMHDLGVRRVLLYRGRSDADQRSPEPDGYFAADWWAALQGHERNLLCAAASLFT